MFAPDKSLEASVEVFNLVCITKVLIGEVGRLEGVREIRVSEESECQRKSGYQRNQDIRNQGVREIRMSEKS